MLRSRGVTTAVALALLASLARPAPLAAAPRAAPPRDAAPVSPIDDARAAVEASDYLKARAAVAAALASGAHGREELAELHRLSGIVAGALGDPKAATAAFQRALALEPRTALPPGTSPKIGRPFAAAKSAAKQSSPLEIKAETAADPPAVTIVVASDPMGMIARVRAAVVVDGAPERVLDRPAAERTTIELPPGARLDVRVAAVDEHGNRLAELGSREVPIVIVGRAPPPRPAPAALPPPPPPPRPREPRPVYLAWWLYGGAAVALGAGATYFGVDAVLRKRELDDLNRDSQRHSFDEAKDVESRARRSVLLANIGYGAAGALAVAATVLYLTAPRAPRERPAPRVTVSPAPGGGALVLGGSF